MPPKGWTSGRPEGIVKGVRLTEATIERIARHVERLQAQLSFVRVNEGMAIRNLIEIGLDTAEANTPQPPTPQPTREMPQQTMPEPSPQLVTHETLTPEPDAQHSPTPASLPPAPTGMQYCRNKLHLNPLGMKGECPACTKARRDRENRTKRQRRAEQKGQPRSARGSA
jgi:hypothetical protein